MKKEYLVGGIALIILTLVILFQPRPKVSDSSESSVSYNPAYTSEGSSPDTSGLVNISSMSADESVEYFRKLGAADALKLDHAKIYAQGRQLIVYQGEIDSYVSSTEISGQIITEAEAYQRIIERKALCNAAINAGLAPRKEDIQQAVEKTRTGAESASNRYEFDAYLSGLSLSEDKYWSTLGYADIENSMLYTNYINTLKPAFLKKYNLDPNTNIESSRFAYKDEWKQALKDEAERLIKLDGTKLQ